MCLYALWYLYQTNRVIEGYFFLEPLEGQCHSALPASGVMLQHHRGADAAAAAPTRTTRVRAAAAAAEVVAMEIGGHECVLSTVWTMAAG